MSRTITRRGDNTPCRGDVNKNLWAKGPGTSPRYRTDYLESHNKALDFVSRPLYPHERSERLERSEWSLCATSAKNEGDEVPLPNGLPTPPKITTGGIVDRLGPANPYALHPEVVLRASTTVAGLSRRGIRKRLAHEAQVNYLAVLDPASGASTQDRLKAADGAARVSGLTRDDQVKVTVTFTMRGWGAPPTKVVDASPVPPLPDGAGGARGEGG